MVVKSKDCVILFAGEEEFLKEQELNRIKLELFKQNQVNLNYDLFYGREADGEKIIECVNTRPLLSPRRLVVIKDVEQLTNFNKELILNYCRQPSPFTCLILETRQRNLNRDKFLASLSRYARVILFKPLYDEKLSQWIRQRLRGEGKKICDDALKLLQENASGGLNNLARLLENLVIYAKDKDEITHLDIEKLIGGDIQVDAFRFTDALGNKDFLRAIGILSALFKEGKEALQILGLILWHLWRIDKAKQMISNGKSKDDLSRELKINPYFLEDFIKQVKNFSIEELRRASQILLETDLNIKMGKIKPDLALELAVVKLCR